MKTSAKVLLGSVAVLLSGIVPAVSAVDRPNILWITSEDNGPELGCYGDDYAITPHIDALAKKSSRYLHFWSNAPVCAPARTTIITGVYPPATGAEHMRSNVPLSPTLKMYPQILREAGYYCTNNSKEDYNQIKPGEVWDASSGKAHWKNRQPGQPFFAIFNHTISHESQIRNRIDQKNQIHDTAKARIPAYHPDTAEVRKDWAQYYDRITMMDELVGRNLAELEDAGVADDTIVFYYGDHGSGMPRSKRWPYNSGLHVPLIVHIPEKFSHLRPEDYATGGTSDRLTAFVDLAPTLLSLIGQAPPEWMQGHAFAGKYDAGPQPYIYGFRGRMDERYDLVRSVTDGRYVYIRQYMPHKIYGQYIQYMFQTPTTRVWKEMFDNGQLNAAQSHFWQQKPSEELYDLHTDRDEVNNLAKSSEHQNVLQKLRQAQRDLAVKIRDVGFMSEDDLHSLAEGSTPYDVGHDTAKYDLESILTAAEDASSRDAGKTDSLVSRLSDSNRSVRYWAALGLLMRGEAGLQAGHDALIKSLSDESPSVRVIAAQVLAQFGSNADNVKGLAVLVKHASIESNTIFVSMLAFNALDELDDRAASVAELIKELPDKSQVKYPRMDAYVPNLKSRTLSDLQATK
ncbi:MAG: sulfatase-like hydrolase/transferase [Planctomycetota bacterium]|nr:sulfatase-like hydrolase/transferase [Planctomycetota bacterium]MDA1161841.1 sulfatase-like hydrolase/transferase [Planctomycetota bacterium]